MPVHRDNLKDIVDAAWVAALESPVPDDPGKRSTRWVHGERSTRWVDALARQFQANYALDRRHRVFWRGREGKVPHFGVKELLFDITVCSVSTTLSLQRPPQPLEFISDCHWQVESEFADSTTRPVIVDMSKLVLGSSENKLIVAARRDDEGRGRQNILAQCADIAACCRTNVFFLFVSHPRSWLNAPSPPLLYEWTAGDWRLISARSE